MFLVTKIECNFMMMVNNQGRRIIISFMIFEIYSERFAPWKIFWLNIKISDFSNFDVKDNFVFFSIFI